MSLKQKRVYVTIRDYMGQADGKARYENFRSLVVYGLSSEDVHRRIKKLFEAGEK